MRKIREVLRLRFECGRAHRQIGASCGIGGATVSDYLRRARDSGVSLADAQQLTDTELEARLYGKTQFAAFADRAPSTSSGFIESSGAPA